MGANQQFSEIRDCILGRRRTGQEPGDLRPQNREEFPEIGKDLPLKGAQGIGDPRRFCLLGRDRLLQYTMIETIGALPGTRKLRHRRIRSCASPAASRHRLAQSTAPVAIKGSFCALQLEDEGLSLQSKLGIVFRRRTHAGCAIVLAVVRSTHSVAPVGVCESCDCVWPGLKGLGAFALTLRATRANSSSRGPNATMRPWRSTAAMLSAASASGRCDTMTTIRIFFRSA